MIVYLFIMITANIYCDIWKLGWFNQIKIFLIDGLENMQKSALTITLFKLY